MARTLGSKDIRGRERLNLVHDLAANDLTAEALADKYDRHVQTVHDFARRNRTEIDEARRTMAGELAGLWIARKESRIAEYQQKFEDIESILAEDHDPPLGHGDANRYTVTQLKILASVAEEMGHLPSRVPGEGPAPVILRHEVVGVDLALALLDPRFDPVSR